MSDSREVRIERDALAVRLDADALAEACARQPALFPDMPPPVAVIRAARSYAHTGRAITADEQRVGKVAVLAAAGFSLRAICRQTGESRNTVAAAVAELERLGKLEPVKEAVGRELAHLVHDQMEVVGDLLAQNERSEKEVADLKAGWVGIGVGLTHMGAARPAQVQHLHLHRVAPVDPARGYLEALEAAAAAPPASEADAYEGRPLTINVNPVSDTGSDTDRVSDPGPSGADPATGPAAAKSHEAGASEFAGRRPGRRGRGGGSDPRGGPGELDGLPSDNFGAARAQTTPNNQV